MEHSTNKLADAIFLLIQKFEERIENNNTQLILCRMEKIIMTQTELTAALDAQTTQIGKIAQEQSDRFDALTKTIADLNAVITAGGDVTPEVTTALANTQAALDSLDAAIPDAPVARG